MPDGLLDDYLKLMFQYFDMVRNLHRHKHHQVRGICTSLKHSESMRVYCIRLQVFTQPCPYSCDRTIRAMNLSCSVNCVILKMRSFSPSFQHSNKILFSLTTKRLYIVLLPSFSTCYEFLNKAVKLSTSR